MRYPGSEKLEIIRLVEQSHLPVRRTLAALDGGLPYYRLYFLGKWRRSLERKRAAW